jgi:hypothetical protein
MAVAEEGAFIMEIETPPMKGDLVRMHDAYGRQGTGYENINEYSNDFSMYEYRPFEQKDYKSWKFKNLEISLTKKQPEENIDTVIIVPISNTIKMRTKKVIDVGEAVTMNNDTFQNEEIITPNYRFLVFKSFK